MSSFKEWYKDNAAELSIKRKTQYALDAEYREKAKEAARQYRATHPRDRTTLVIPPEYSIGFPEAAEELGVDISTLRTWLEKDYFPAPKKFGNAYRLTMAQLQLLKMVQDFFSKNGSRKGPLLPQFADLRGFVGANW